MRVNVFALGLIIACGIHVGCSSETGSAVGAASSVDTPSSMNAVDAALPVTPGMPTMTTGAARLMIIGDAQQAALTNTALNLQVVFEQAGRPIPGQRIDFEMLDNQNRVAGMMSGVDGHILTAWSTTTNASGVGAVTVQVGGSETGFKVRAKAANAAPVEWTITVRSKTNGGLNVQLTYAAMGQRYTYASLSRAQMFLFNDQANRKTCDNLLREPDRIVGADFLEELNPFSAMDNQRVIENLAAGATYTIAAVAFDTTRDAANPMGKRVAIGCIEQAAVRGGALTDVMVPLTDMPLQYKGIFTVRSKLNIREALNQPDAMGDFDRDCDSDLCRLDKALTILQLIGGMDEDRIDAFRELFCGVVSLDGPICRLVATFATASLLDPILDQILPQGAPELYTIFKALADIVKIMEEFTVIGQMEFVDSTPDINGNLKNNDDRWNKFEYTWRPGADGVVGNECLPNSDCVKILPLEEAHGDNCPPSLSAQERREGDGAPCTMNDECTTGNCRIAEGICGGCVENRAGRRTVAISSPFDAVINGATMEIKEHTLNIRYGLLALNIAQYWIIPSILSRPAPITLEEMIRGLLDNQDGTGNSVCSRINMTVDDTTFCQEVLIPSLADLLAGVLYDLTIADDSLTLRGTVTPQDTDGDLIIDKLAGGVWTGRIGDNAMFPGCFNGCRGSDCIPVDCTIPDRGN
ncbi:MAG: hypothetical protein VX589_05635 [Myxococcota bacterium]|nr:hypothetical protein [Myxococcota bacterium]